LFIIFKSKSGREVLNKAEYATMAERERAYWWHIGRLHIIDTYIRHAKGTKSKLKILNVGSGTGGTIDMLEKHGVTDNVDISNDAIKFMKQRGYTRITKVKDTKLPFKDKTYDIVGAFDVLEHIDKQVDALKEWKRVLKDPGAIIITVPAYQWLWTDHDVSLHHKRRYTIKRLAEAGKQAGLKIDKKTYAITFSLPLVVGFRFLNKALGRKTDSETSYVNVPKWLNTLFSKLLYLEAKVHRIMPFPAGTSVLVVFRKAK
jgi:SAM-dependent methyltransferase